MRKLLATLAVAVLPMVSASAAGFQDCPQFFVKGASPKLLSEHPGAQRELCFDAFAVKHSGVSKTPIFVAERLNRAQLLNARDEERTDKFYEEARLPTSDRSRLGDYKAGLILADNSKFSVDRGHMAPAADMPTAAAMAQSFSLSNMVPQAPTNNRKVWAGIEKDTRKYVMRSGGNVYVFTGPHYEGQVAGVGPGQVWYPTHLFKLVYDESLNRAWAHWIANTNEARASRPISYEELVRRTGIDFLPGIKPAS